MSLSFFNKAIKKDQNQKHINCVFQLYLIKFMDIDSNRLESIVHTRKNYGYQKAFEEIFHKHLPLQMVNFFSYLKKRYEVKNGVFEEIVGMKEIQSLIKYPKDYTAKQKMTLIFHLMLLSVLDGFTERQNHHFLKIAKDLNFSAKQITFLVNSANDKLNFWQNFEDTEKIENMIYNDLKNNFNIENI